jgi:hypothetical protein
MLIITNGDSAVDALRAAGIEGDLLPWRDVLHDGPVPDVSSPSALADVRARYLASGFQGDFSAIQADFRQRDEILQSLDTHEETVLWFEHDLYDQLQLIQILDRLAAAPPRRTRLTLICRAEYIAESDAGRLVEAFEKRGPVTDAQQYLGRRAWEAFTRPTPEGLSALALAKEPADLSSLPYLCPAMLRLLEEYPGPRDGLSRNERQILEALRSGHRRPGDLFRAVQRMEDARYLGDASFWKYVSGLAGGRAPLVGVAGQDGFMLPGPHGPRAEFLEQSLHLTEAGADVLAGHRDAIALNGIDRWIGGVHLQEGAVWRWDARERRWHESP